MPTMSGYGFVVILQSLLRKPQVTGKGYFNQPMGLCLPYEAMVCMNAFTHEFLIILQSTFRTASDPRIAFREIEPRKNLWDYVCHTRLWFV